MWWSSCDLVCYHVGSGQEGFSVASVRGPYPGSRFRVPVSAGVDVTGLYADQVCLMKDYERHTLCHMLPDISQHSTQLFLRIVLNLIVISYSYRILFNKTEYCIFQYNIDILRLLNNSYWKCYVKFISILCVCTYYKCIYVDQPTCTPHIFLITLVYKLSIYKILSWIFHILMAAFIAY